MKFPGSIGVMIIIISFFGAAFISAIEITPIYKENSNYEYKPESLLKDQSEVKLSEYQDYVIPKEEKNETKAAQHITLFDKGHYSADNATLAYSEATPLKTILNSLKYSENCQSIIVDFNLKIEEWKEQSIKYPTTPILCTYKTPHHLIPVGFNGSWDYLTNVIFEYTPGDAVINLKNYDDDKYIDSTYLAIDNLFIGHHYDKLAYHKGFSTFELKTEESDYIIKWCEKEVKNNSLSNFIIDIEETQPSLYSNIYSGEYSYKVNLSNFTKYGDKLTINGIFHNIVNNQIVIGEPYDLKNIDILYENKNCILKLNDIDKTVNLGPICNYKIIGSGDWEFESKFYECNHTNEITGYEWNTNPSALFNINSSFIIVFIGTVLILSGLCSFSIGLNFIDLAVIISIIAFILVM